MRIFSTRALKFDHPTGAQAPVRIQAHSFLDVPDWVKKSAMYILAAEHDIVSVIESKVDEIKAEKGADKKKAE